MNAINEQVRTTTKNRQIIGIGKKQKKSELIQQGQRTQFLGGFKKKL